MSIRWWLSLLGSTAALLFAPAAVVNFSAYWLLGDKRWRESTPWLLVWVPILLLGLWRITFGDGWWLIAVAVTGASYSLVIKPRRVTPVIIGLGVAILIFVATAFASTVIQRKSWHTYSYSANQLRVAFDWLRGTSLLVAKGGDAAFGQLWEVPAGTSKLSVSLDLRTPVAGADPATVRAFLTRAGGQVSQPLSPAADATTEWARTTWTFPVERSERATRHTVVLRVAAGQAVEARAIHVSSNGGGVPRQIAFSPRAQLWYGDPNIAGHSVAMAGLVALSLTSSPGLAAILLAASGGAVALTGSRTALIALALGAIALVMAQRRARRLRLLTLLAGALAVVALLLLRPEVLGSLSRFVIDGNSVPRQEIWRFAMGLSAERPWFGWGAGGFADAWQLAHAGASSPQVTHAHNLLLEFLVAYGIPGGLTVAVFSWGLLRVAWLRRRSAGATIALVALLLSTTDYTLFSSAVLALLILGVNTDELLVANGASRPGAK